MERSRNPPRTQLIPTHPLNLSTHLLLCWTHPTPKCLFSLKNLQEPPKWPSFRAYSPTIHFLHSNQSDLLRKMGHTISLLESFPELPTKFRIQPKFLTWLTQALYDLAPPMYLTYLLPASFSRSLSMLKSHWPLSCLSNASRSPTLRDLSLCYSHFLESAPSRSLDDWLFPDHSGLNVTSSAILHQLI